MSMTFGKGWLSPLKIVFCMIFVVLVWGMYLLSTTNFHFNSSLRESEYLKSEIVKLSQKYITALAKEKDTKKFGKGANLQTAVLLQNMLTRIEQLETQMEYVITNSTHTFANMVSAIQNLNDTIYRVTANRSSIYIETICEVPQDSTFPHCINKVEWLKENWKKFPKFSKHGVNGTVCSFLVYLSHVEDHCPKNFRVTYKRKLAMHSGKVAASSGGAVMGQPNEDECHEYINDVAYPHCKPKVAWMKKFWKSDPVYASHGVNGSVCSFVKYLSEVENWCPLMSGRKTETETCVIPKDPAFPTCGDKVVWMRKFWTSDACYRQYGVNGTVCSFLSYLSEVESFCPLQPGRQPVPLNAKEKKATANLRLTQTDVKELLKIVQKGGEVVKYQWMSDRITRLWPDWLKGFDSLKARLKLDSYPRKRILIYIGFLADEPIYHFGAHAGKGGPLGELVQWSDIIACLYLLGHELVVSSNKAPTHKHGIKKILSGSVGGLCPNAKSSEFDLIYTDYIGLAHIIRANKNINNLKCHLRLVDSFGTEAQFNYKTDQTKKNVYGFHGLNLKQYNTMFPHSPDNTFLGFVVENHISPTEELKKKNIALVYGKHISMWKDSKKLKFLDVIKKYFEVHATVGNPAKEKAKALTYALPSFVNNHGVLKGNEIQKLLRETTLFVGLGFPYEGPAPLEAIANGCFFLNPKLIPPLGRDNHPFFKTKPTLRKLTSQHPYAEMYIGKPYVYTMDLDNATALAQVMEDIKGKTAHPYLPFEYTYEGMLERVFALLKHQDFCTAAPPPESMWPPLSAKQVFYGGANEACDEVCFKKGLICEPAYFPLLNNADNLSHYHSCRKVSRLPSLVAPAIKVGDTAECLLQSNVLLYSCTSKSPSTARLCPCRDFVKGQTALCKDCLKNDR